MTAPERRARVIAVLMGLGHLRAAYPLKRLDPDGMTIYGLQSNTPMPEYRMWRRMLQSYYFFSRAGNIPFIGGIALRILLWVQNIGPYYPRRDCSRPSAAVLYLDHLIARRGLGQAIIDKVRLDPRPVIHTYFATAIAVDQALGEDADNFLVICDSDFNRVWVPKHPRKSRIKYCAPCTQVKRRLMSYGVPEEHIYLTGFPLPRENIGSEKSMETLKLDLFNRIVRLDPDGRFFRVHHASVSHWLGCTDDGPRPRDSSFTVTFAIGGAGAQTDLAHRLLSSLAPSIRKGMVRVNLSVGIQKRIFEKASGFIHRLGLYDQLNKGVRIVFGADPATYLDKFNSCLRTTDVLWTKPSELVFYSALGLPIVMAPPIGTHEELNKRWLQEIHAGILPPGPVDYCHEWLFDLRDSGRLAEAAWDGFLKGRKLGTFKIERLVTEGVFYEGANPLEW